MVKNSVAKAVDQIKGRLTVTQWMDEFLLSRDVLPTGPFMERIPASWEN